MTTDAVTIRPFDRTLVRASRLDCGEPALDAWLGDQASQQERRGNVRTVLAVREPSGPVLGYHACQAYRLDVDAARAAWPSRRYPVPAALIAKLAVDRAVQGRGIGRRLLLDALLRVERASQDVGIEVVVVDALHEDAACFYLKYGFRRFADRELRLFLTVRDLRTTLRAAT